MFSDPELWWRKMTGRLRICATAVVLTVAAAPTFASGQVFFVDDPGVERLVEAVEPTAPEPPARLPTTSPDPAILAEMAAVAGSSGIEDLAWDGAGFVLATISDLEANSQQLVAAGRSTESLDAVIDRLRTLLPAEGASQPVSVTGGPPSTLQCNIDRLIETARPSLALLVDLFRRLTAEGAAFGAEDFMSDPVKLPPHYQALFTYEPLASDEALDRFMGGNYWTARWHQKQAAWHIHYWTSMLALAGHDVTRAIYERLPEFPEKADIDRAMSEVMEVRGALLTSVAGWATQLEQGGCKGWADLLRANTYFELADGQERLRLNALGVPYLAAFNHEAGLVYDRRGAFPVDDILERLPGQSAPEDPLVSQTVESFLGPMPPIPVAENPGHGAAVAVKRGTDLLLEAVLDDPASFEETEASWDRPPTRRPVAAGTGRSPSVNSEQISGTMTLISAAGVGDFPQPDLAGFWHSPDLRDATATLLVTSEEGRRFEGFSVGAEGPKGRWLDMRQEGETTGWRGEVYVSLREPEGACGRWTDGVFVYKPGDSVLQGAWAGPKPNPETCENSNTPHGDAIRLERLVTTRFMPIVPGKFIHILGVPAAGSTSAQYAAAVEFGCVTEDLPVQRVEVRIDSGRLVTQPGACRYQFVADAPGGYDIAVDLIDGDGKVIHTDHLRAEIPAIPGLIQ